MSGHGDASSNGASETILARHPDRALRPTPAPAPAFLGHLTRRPHARGLDLDRPVSSGSSATTPARTTRPSVASPSSSGASPRSTPASRAVCLNVERLYVSRNRIRDFPASPVPALRLLARG